MPEAEKPGYQFGTFKGVFTPSILTIIGVIMYLRFGWVIGNVGLIPTLIIVTISTSITFFTALSVSALATNTKVKGGGAYNIVSRSLGIEVGAAIGLPFPIYRPQLRKKPGTQACNTLLFLNRLNRQKGNNAGLILALAHLLSTSPLWQNSRLVLRTIIMSEADQSDTEEGLRTFVEQGRLAADVKTVLIEDADLFGTIAKHSKDADFVFMGLHPPAPEETFEEYSQYLKNIIQKTQGVQYIAYVLSSEDIEFKKIFSTM